MNTDEHTAAQPKLIRLNQLIQLSEQAATGNFVAACEGFLPLYGWDCTMWESICLACSIRANPCPSVVSVGRALTGHLGPWILFAVGRAGPKRPHPLARTV